jgi:hypothetical protein
MGYRNIATVQGYRKSCRVIAMNYSNTTGYRNSYSIERVAGLGNSFRLWNQLKVRETAAGYRSIAS